MDRTKYLLELAKIDPDEVYQTWKALGSLVVTNFTKVYTQGTLFILNLDDMSELELDGQDLDFETDNMIEVDGWNAENELKRPGGIINGAMIYCTSDYIVDGKDFPMIDWTTATIEEIENSVQIYDGVNLPHFKVILTKAQVDGCKTDAFDEDFIPFHNAKIKTSEIFISDDELDILLTECGCPYIRLDELEYTRDIILNTCIKPALQEYYKFFPIVREYDIGTYGGNQEFEFELPAYAYNAVVFYTIGAGGASQSKMSPFAYFTSEIMGGGIPAGGGGTFGRGLSYRKPVPGFVGSLGGGIDAMLQALQAQQGLLNYWRREKVNRVKKNGKIYMHGFSTIGGNLCAKVMYWSPDWDMIDFEDLPQVRDMCKAYVLRNIGMIRQQVKTDIPGAIDYSLWLQRGDALYERVTKYWNTTTENLRWTPQRGGLG